MDATANCVECVGNRSNYNICECPVNTLYDSTSDICPSKNKFNNFKI